MKAEEFKPFAEEWESMIMRMTKIELIREILKTALMKKIELIEICTKLIDANSRESVIETIEWTDELEDYLKTNKS